MVLYIKNDKGNLADLGGMHAKDIYKILMKKKIKTPTARYKWMQILNDCEEIQLAGHWTYWLFLPNKHTREVRLKSFQFRISHRTLPCNKYLRQIRILQSPVCSFCAKEDTIMHFLYGCSKTKQFWESLVHNSDQVIFPRVLSETDFLFGIRDSGKVEFQINFIILLGKFYVYRQKLYHKGNLDVHSFLVDFKNNLAIERLACIMKNSVRRKFAVWEQFYEEL